MKGHKVVHMIAFLLVVVGGLNWLLVGLIGKDVGMLLFGSQTALVSRVIYILVGIATVELLLCHKKDCKMCDSTPAAPTTTV